MSIQSSPAIKAEYDKAIRKIYQDLSDGAMMERFKEIQRQQLGVLTTEFFFLEEFDLSELMARAAYLTRTLGDMVPLNAPLDVYRFTIHANLINDGPTNYLEIANAVPHVVQIDSLVWINKYEDKDLAFQPEDSFELPLKLPPLEAGALPDFQRFYFDPTEHANRYRLEVGYTLIDAGVTSHVVASPYFGPMEQPPIPSSTPEEQLSQHPFLSLEAGQRTFRIEPGHWRVMGSITVPEGYRLFIPAGTMLEFEPDASLISYGPVMLQGTENDPVVLRGILPEDGISPSSWQGVAVLSADAPSIWSFARILDTSGVRRPGWELTGGVTFYQSEVHMEHSVFKGHRGEDALNFIRSPFRLEDVRVVDTASDGLDADFSDGVVTGGTFEKIGHGGGGDAIDVSGAHVEIDGVHFSSVADKALSVGEHSQVTAANLVIEDVGTGAASKDGSTLIIRDSSIVGARIAALFAYVKKPGFGPGTIEAHDLWLEGNLADARAQIGSLIEIDGQEVPVQELDVDELYRTVITKSAQ